MMNERPLEPPEPKDKCFVFTCDCSSKIEFAVWAENIDEARERLNNSEYEEFTLKEFQIEDELDYDIED